MSSITYSLAVKKPTFADLMKDIEVEAKAEGPEAVAQLERLRHRYAIGGQILLLRIKRGMTQKDLAAKTGIQQSEISGRGAPAM